MRSSATTVEGYLAELPEERRTALVRLRRACLGALLGCEEKMLYGMPTYTRDGAAEVTFASQKNHIALYITKPEVVNAHREALAVAKSKVGKGCITLAGPNRIPFDLVDMLLTDMARSHTAPR